MVDSIKKRLLVEFIIIYILLPSAIIFTNTIILKSKIIVFSSLFLVFFISIYLLKSTPNFSFKNLKKKVDWNFCLIFSLIFMVSGFLYTTIFDSELLFSLPRDFFFIWLLVLIVYPILSVVPQEIIFRVLFFERYACLFKNLSLCLIFNSLIFAYIHLVFENFHAFFITVITSPIFAYAYLKKSFKTCLLIHTIGGQLVFTYGLGKYFY
mgnify:CR=1 FL=1|jgi:hypothetical protein|tara:strand:- start:2262 stop:2888 length:627 start_codon:yes stop_codon:yes gene_type:complete